MRYVVSHLLSVIWGINIGAILMSISLDHLDGVESVLSQIFGERFQIWMAFFGTHAEAQLYLAQSFAPVLVVVSGILYFVVYICRKLVMHK